MNTYSNFCINPLIQPHTADTVRLCANGLSYISKSVNGLSEHELPLDAYRGLAALTECLQRALEYEFYRLKPAPIQGEHHR